VRFDGGSSMTGTDAARTSVMSWKKLRRVCMQWWVNHSNDWWNCALTSFSSRIFRLGLDTLLFPGSLLLDSNACNYVQNSLIICMLGIPALVPEARAWGICSFPTLHNYSSRRNIQDRLAHARYVPGSLCGFLE
jgi:hypothetical protein